MTKTSTIDLAPGVTLTVEMSHVSGMTTTDTATITRDGAVAVQDPWSTVSYRLTPAKRALGWDLVRSLSAALAADCPAYAAAIKADRVVDDVAAEIARQEGVSTPRLTLSRSTVSA
jgi:hypothetical protein